jgi:hypothetical protein
MCGEGALVKLLAVREHVRGERHANRATGITRRIEQRGGMVGLERSGGMPS